MSKRACDEISQSDLVEVVDPLYGFETPSLPPDAEFTRLFVNQGATIPELFFKHYTVQKIIRNVPRIMTKYYKDNHGIVLKEQDLRLCADGTMRIAVNQTKKGKKKTDWNPFDILGTVYWFTLDFDVRVDGVLYEAGTILYAGETGCWVDRERSRACNYNKWHKSKNKDKLNATTKLFTFVRDTLGGVWEMFTITKTTMDKRHILRAERYVTEKYDPPLNDDDGGSGEFFGSIYYDKRRNTYLAYYKHNGERFWSTTDPSIDVVYDWLKEQYKERLKENYAKFIKKPLGPLDFYKQRNK